MITNENVISRLEKFRERPIPQYYAPFRYELMGLIQEGKLRLETPNLIHKILSVDTQIVSYRRTPEGVANPCIVESAVQRIPTNQIQLNESQAGEVTLAISDWSKFRINSCTGPLDFAYGIYDDVERSTLVEIGLFAQELSLVDWLSNPEFIEACNKLYAKDRRLSDSADDPPQIFRKFSDVAMELLACCLQVEPSSTSCMAKLINTDYIFDVITNVWESAEMLSPAHSSEFFELRKLIDQTFNLPSIDKHSDQAFAIRYLDWIISRYRPDLTEELEARPQLPIWTDEDTRRNNSN